MGFVIGILRAKARPPGQDAWIEVTLSQGSPVKLISINLKIYHFETILI
jgi:hypothetical protein